MGYVNLLMEPLIVSHLLVMPMVYHKWRYEVLNMSCDLTKSCD